MNTLHSHELTRSARLHVELHVDALLSRVMQPEPCQFCAVEPELIPSRRQSVWIGVWFVIALGIAAASLNGVLV